ncbi:GntR family transcriptional regulator [Salipaludibacillus sp. CF4.18]|uniref:GntR family transcriptional regulator n=1 Tax=Salipaludibacillus sp. CF4.18 TaxID=3373081 RepID=UPI003EE7D3D6
MINKSSPIPIYHQLEERIKTEIEEGSLKSGDLLPSEREYAETFKISRMTVRQAISNLVSNGYVYRKKGTGTFVSQKKFEQILPGLTSFTEDMKRRGMVPSNELVEFSILPASEEVAHALDIKNSESVYKIERIRLADNFPIALETTFVSKHRIEGITEEIAHTSLYEYFESTLNLNIDHATQLIESSIINSEEKKLLHMKTGDPVLLIQRTTYLDDGTPLEFVKSVYRADRYRFMIDMKR